MPEYRIIAAALVLSAAGLAQTRVPSDAWLMQNYRFTGPPAPGSLQPVSPVVAQLTEIQNAMLSIMRKADFYGDFETALAAAAQATANAQLIGAITGQLKPPQPGPPGGPRSSNPAPAHYFVAFRDGTIQVATAVWTDHLMLHYLTPTGAHEQVRLDRVDWKLTAELNPKPAEAATPQRPGDGDNR